MFHWFPYTFFISLYEFQCTQFAFGCASTASTAMNPNARLSNRVTVQNVRAWSYCGRLSTSLVARVHLLVFYWLDGGHYFGVIVLNRTNHVQIYGDNSRLSWTTSAPSRGKTQPIINWFRCFVNKQSHVFDSAFPLCTYRSLRVFFLLHLLLCNEDNDCNSLNLTHCDQTRCDNSFDRKNMPSHESFKYITLILIHVNLGLVEIPRGR